MSEINKKVKCNLVNCGFTYPRKINHRKKNILKIKLNRDFYQDVFKLSGTGFFIPWRPVAFYLYRVPTISGKPLKIVSIFSIQSFCTIISLAHLKFVYSSSQVSLISWFISSFNINAYKTFWFDCYFKCFYSVVIKHNVA